MILPKARTAIPVRMTVLLAVHSCLAYNANYDTNAPHHEPGVHFCKVGCIGLFR